MTTPQIDNDAPHLLTEWQLIAALRIREQVLAELGFGPEDLPERGRPIRAAVKQLRLVADDAETLVRLDAALEVDSALLAFIEHQSHETFGTLASAFEAFTAMATRAVGPSEVIH